MEMFYFDYQVMITNNLFRGLSIIELPLVESSQAMPTFEQNVTFDQTQRPFDSIRGDS